MDTKQKNSPLRPPAEQEKRCGRGNQGTQAQCTADSFVHSFLKFRFPILVTDEAVLWNADQREEDFFNGLQSFSETYRYIPPNVAGVSYPYNLRLVINDANQFLARKSGDTTLFFAELETGEESLSTVSVFNTRNTLYHLPLKPLWLLYKSKAHRKESLLLSSVLSYCLQVAAIPSYTNGDAVGMYYTMASECLMESRSEYSKEEFRSHMGEYREADRIGKRLSKSLMNPVHIKSWERRMLRFSPSDEIGYSLLNIADKFYSLYQNYPNATFHQNISTGFLCPDADYRISPDEYLSFTWSYRGWLNEELKNYLKCNYNEAEIQDEPLNVIAFDQSGTHTIGDTSYEQELFELLHEMADLLNDIEHYPFNSQNPPL